MNTLTSANAALRAVQTDDDRNHRFGRNMCTAIVLLQFAVLLGMGFWIVRAGGGELQFPEPAHIAPANLQTGMIGSDPASADARRAANEADAILIGTVSRGSGKANP